MDAHLTFPELSYMSNALSDSCLQIQKLVFYLMSSAVVWV